jgi:hypothetical protein
LLELVKAWRGRRQSGVCEAFLGGLPASSPPWGNDEAPELASRDDMSSSGASSAIAGDEIRHGVNREMRRVKFSAIAVRLLSGFMGLRSDIYYCPFPSIYEDDTGFSERLLTKCTCEGVFK